MMGSVMMGPVMMTSMVMVSISTRNRRKLEYAGEWVAALELWRTLVRVALVKGR
jgi:hypothetical protein